MCSYLGNGSPPSNKYCIKILVFLARFLARFSIDAKPILKKVWFFFEKWVDISEKGIILRSVTGSYGLIQNLRWWSSEDTSCIFNYCSSCNNVCNSCESWKNLKKSEIHSWQSEKLWYLMNTASKALVLFDNWRKLFNIWTMIIHWSNLAMCRSGYINSFM